MSRTPLVTVGIVVCVAFGVAVVLTAGTALVAAAGHIAGDIALDSGPLDDSPDGPATAGNATVPGVSENGTANISAVLQSHRNTLSSQGYVAVTNATDRRNGTIAVAQNRTYRATPNGSHLLVVEHETDAQGSTREVAVWANDSHRLTRQSTDDDEAYGISGRVPVTPVPPTTDPFVTAFSRVDGEFVVTDAATVDGHRVVTLAAPLQRSADGDAGGTLTLRVDDRGVVRRATATHHAADGTQRMTYRLVSLGVDDVPKPGWAGRVSANPTTPDDASAANRSAPGPERGR